MVRKIKKEKGLFWYNDTCLLSTIQRLIEVVQASFSFPEKKTMKRKGLEPSYVLREMLKNILSSPFIPPFLLNKLILIEK
jgi:hypothetical protein